MDSIVLELQRDAAGSSVPVSELLRKALLVARKLDLEDFSHWIKRELDGYQEGDKVPNYRLLAGELRAQNPMRGWIPVMSDDVEFLQSASSAAVGQPVAEIEQLCRKNSGRLMIRRPQVEQYAQMTGDYVLPVYLHISAAGFTAILHAIRQAVLEWTVDLEKRGILGEGMQFRPKDKEAAREVTHAVNLTVASGGIAQLHYGDNGVQNVHTSGLKSEDVEQLVQALKASNAPSGIAVDLAMLIGQLKDLAKQPNPPKSKIRETLITMKEVASTGTGAAVLVEKVSELIAMLS